MAHATVKGRKHEVRVTSDLAENYAVEIYPEPLMGTVKRSEPFKPWPVPLCVKLRADSKEDALFTGLTHMKHLGRIDSFHLEPSEMPAKPAASEPV